MVRIDEDQPTFEKIKRHNHLMARKAQWNMCLKKKGYDENKVGSVIKKVKDERGVDVRFYKCPLCHKYHLTKGFGSNSLGE